MAYYGHEYGYDKQLGRFRRNKKDYAGSISLPECLHRFLSQNERWFDNSEDHALSEQGIILCEIMVRFHAIMSFRSSKIMRFRNELLLFKESLAKQIRLNKQRGAGKMEDESLSKSWKSGLLLALIAMILAVREWNGLREHFARFPVPRNDDWWRREKRREAWRSL